MAWQKGIEHWEKEQEEQKEQQQKAEGQGS